MDTPTPTETLADDGLNQTMVNTTATQDLSNLSVLVEARDKHRNEFSLGHLNINNLQNKFEEIAEFIKKSRMQVMVLSDTKIDVSYPDSQFYIPGCSIYRNDRKKGGAGGGGMLAYVSSDVTSKKLKFTAPLQDHDIEPLALEIDLKAKNIIVIGIFRSPSQAVYVELSTTA